MKKCSNCGQTKNTETGFYTQKGTTRAKCRDCINKVRKIYYQNNREKLLQQKSVYTKSHKKEKALYDKEYRKKNAVKFAEAKKRYCERNKNNPEYKMRRNLRRRVHHALKGDNKSAHTMELMGCTIEFFIAYIESLWLEGMSWENYGPYGWHIDHIIPCYTFDLSKPEEQRKCFHYTNQRPLWWRDNLSRPKSGVDYAISINP